MAAKKSGALAGLIGKVSTQGRTVEYGGATILVAPLLSVGEARRLDAVRQRAGTDDQSFIDELVSLFIARAKDPETGEPFASESERKQVTEEIPMDLLLKVLQAASGMDPAATAKN